jgi:hypothetical protein
MLPYRYPNEPQYQLDIPAGADRQPAGAEGPAARHWPSAPAPQRAGPPAGGCSRAAGPAAPPGCTPGTGTGAAAAPPLPFLKVPSGRF